MKRVLLVSYYYPPSGGSGVQRMLKFSKYLRECGWEPVVLTVDPVHAAFPDLDEELERDIPDGLEVIRTRSWDPYAVYARLMGLRKESAVGVGFLADRQEPDIRERISRWVRANLFLPDARVGWVPFAIRAARSLMKRHAVHAIVTSGPPHSAHLVGAHLKKRFGIPWLADLRDAWPDVAYRHMLPTTALAGDMDCLVRDHALASADIRVTVTNEVAAWMESETGLPFEVIPNGFDPADIEEANVRLVGGFSIVHTGNMGPARDPEPLWSLLSTDRWPDVSLVLVGNVDGSIHRRLTALQSDRQTAGLKRLSVERHAYVPHSEAIAFMKGASLLLLPINRVTDGAGIVTGKIYEYLASGRPVLGLGETGGEADRILRAAGAGRVFDYNDVDGIGTAIDTAYAAWKAGAPQPGATPEGASPWSRRAQTRQLSSFLNDLTS